MNPERAARAKDLHKQHKQLVLTINVLDADVRFAADHWRKAPNSQFWRRTLVRCLCALTEGTLGLLKAATPDTAHFFHVVLTKDDIKVATQRREYEENGVIKTKPAFLPFRDNIKATFTVFAKAHATQVALRCGDAGFNDLCDTFELRNKLMHPKSLFDLEVSDKAVAAADQGMKWFDSTLRAVLEQCGSQLPYRRK